MDDTSSEVMERRLQAWGAWLAGGGCGDGYPSKSVLHKSWLPPTAGTLPSIKVGGGDASERQMHAAILTLSERMARTLLLTYVHRISGQERALRLQCQEATVRARIHEAKRYLLAKLSE